MLMAVRISHYKKATPETPTHCTDTLAHIQWQVLTHCSHHCVFSHTQTSWIAMTIIVNMAKRSRAKSHLQSRQKRGQQTAKSSRARLLQQTFLMSFNTITQVQKTLTALDSSLTEIQPSKGDMSQLGNGCVTNRANLTWGFNGFGSWIIFTCDLSPCLTAASK